MISTQKISVETLEHATVPLGSLVQVQILGRIDCPRFGGQVLALVGGTVPLAGAAAFVDGGALVLPDLTD